MAHRFFSEFDVVPAVIPTAGAAASMTPVEVDARGYDEATFILATGAANTGATIDVKVQESATSGGSLGDHANATDITQLLAASGTSKTVGISMKVNGAKPWLKITGTVGTETFANSIVCVLRRGTGSNPTSSATRATAGLKQVVEVV